MLLYSMTRFFKFLPGEQRQVAAIAQLLPSNRTGERVLPNTRLAAKTIFIGSTPGGRRREGSGRGESIRFPFHWNSLGTVTGRLSARS